MLAVRRPRNKGYFQRSENEPTRALESLLERQSSRHQRVAVTGESGVGKTQAVLEYVYAVHAHDPDCSIFWLDGSSHLKFEQDLMKVGILASLFENVKEVEDLESICSVDVRSEVNSRRDLLSEVTDYLSSPQSGRWILVIAGANNPDVFFDTPKEELFFSGSVLQDPVRSHLIHYLPYSRRGSIIFITRSKDAGTRLTGSHHNVSVSAPSQKDAELMLSHFLELQGYQVTPQDRGLLPAFVGSLGCLPLNIELATVLVVLITKSLEKLVSSYNEALENSIQGELMGPINQGVPDLRLVPPGFIFLAKHFKRSLEEAAPAAHAILALAASFDLKSIPVLIVTRLALFAGLGASTPGVTADSLEKSAGLLAALGLMNTEDVELPDFLRMCMRKWMIDDDEMHFACMTALSLVANITSLEPSWLNSLLVFPASLHATCHMKPRADDEVLVQGLLAMRTCLFMLQNGFHPGLSIALGCEAVNACTQALGSDSVETLLALTYLSRFYIHRKQYEAAEAVLADGIIRSSQIQDPGKGQKHAYIALLNVMAFVLQRQEKSDDALAIAEMALEEAGKVLDPGDPQLLLLRVELATCQTAVYQYDAADRTYTEALEALETIPTLTDEMERQRAIILLNHGNLLTNQTKYREATRLFDRLISSLSPGNPANKQTLTWALVSLGSVQSRQGNLEEAQATLAKAIDLSAKHTPSEALAIRPRGEIHADPYALEWMAIVLDTMGSQEAGDYFVRAIRSYERSYGLGDDRAKACLQSYQHFQKTGPGDRKWFQRAGKTSYLPHPYLKDPILLGTDLRC